MASVCESSSEARLSRSWDEATPEPASDADTVAQTACAWFSHCPEASGPVTVATGAASSRSMASIDTTRRVFDHLLVKEWLARLVRNNPTLVFPVGIFQIAVASSEAVCSCGCEVYAKLCWRAFMKTRVSAVVA